MVKNSSRGLIWRSRTQQCCMIIDNDGIDVLRRPDTKCHPAANVSCQTAIIRQKITLFLTETRTSARWPLRYVSSSARYTLDLLRARHKPIAHTLQCTIYMSTVHSAPRQARTTSTDRPCCTSGSAEQEGVVQGEAGGGGGHGVRAAPRSH